MFVGGIQERGCCAMWSELLFVCVSPGKTMQQKIKGRLDGKTRAGYHYSRTNGETEKA